MTSGREPRAGGALLALGILGGAAIGIALGEPSIGVVAGFVLGGAIALGLWWRDRRHDRTERSGMRGGRVPGNGRSEPPPSP